MDAFTIINEIAGFVLMIAAAYSLKTVPQVISEYRGIRETPTKEALGAPPSKYKWMHGTEEKIFLLYIIIGMPILIFVVEQTYNLTGNLILAMIFTLIVVIPTHYYGKKKAQENQAIIDAMPDEEKYRNPEDKDKIYLYGEF